METDSITAPDAEESAMRELGIETDHAQGREDVAPTPEAARPEQPESPEPQAPETEQPEAPPEVPEPGRDHPQQRPRDPVTGKFEKPETPYSKAQKEQIRINRTWQNIQAEKEQMRAEQAQREEQWRMRQLEAARQDYQPLKREGLTAKEYYQGAQRFVQEGDFENAYKAREVAWQLQQAEIQRAQQMEHVEREYHWRNQLNELGRQYPQIYQEPIAGHLQRIIGENPGFYNLPNGFRLAAEGAHLLAENMKMKEMQDEIIALKAELEKSQRKGQPSKGGYASPRTGEKDFDDMGLDDMEAHLKAITAEADGYR